MGSFTPEKESRVYKTCMLDSPEISGRIGINCDQNEHIPFGNLGNKIELLAKLYVVLNGKDQYCYCFKYYHKIGVYT